MKIAINALHVPPGRTGGGETYTLELIRHLDQLDHPHEVAVLALEGARPALTAAALQRTRVRFFQENRLRNLIDRFRPLAWNLPSFAPPYDLIHWPNSQVRPHPVDQRPARILTFLDAQHMVFPEFFSQNDLDARAAIFPESFSLAHRIIAISNYSRQQLLEYYAVPQEKIVTVPLGVNFSRFAAPHDETRLAKYSLPPKYLIYPAGTWPHKNHLRLLDALHLLRQRGHTDIRLVLTGIIQSEHPRVLQKIAAHHLESHVQHLGFIAWDDTPEVIKRAHGMIFPSLFEGFGLPIVEAMAASVPVAASRVAAIPEVGGDAVRYFDPTEVEDMAQAVLDLWNDKDRDALIRAGQNRAAQFTWETTAEKTLAVYDLL